MWFSLQARLPKFTASCFIYTFKRYINLKRSRINTDRCGEGFGPLPAKAFIAFWQQCIRGGRRNEEDIFPIPIYAIINITPNSHRCPMSQRTSHKLVLSGIIQRKFRVRSIHPDRQSHRSLVGSRFLLIELELRIIYASQFWSLLIHTCAIVLFQLEYAIYTLISNFLLPN